MMREKKYNQRKRNINRAWHEIRRLCNRGMDIDDCDKLAGKMMDKARLTSNMRKHKKYRNRWGLLSFAHTMWEMG